MDVECTHCRKTGDETDLRRCRMCHRHVCEDHVVERNGAHFCSTGCSVHYFHAEPDDDDE